MAATASDISRWFDRGVKDGHTNMAVFCDTFDWEDYPVFITATTEDEVRAKIAEHKDRLMEVYVLDPATKAYQLAQHRVFNYIPFNEMYVPSSDKVTISRTRLRQIIGTAVADAMGTEFYGDTVVDKAMALIKVEEG